jgi:outer membrane lipoprotein-sorting protein
MMQRSKNVLFLLLFAGCWAVAPVEGQAPEAKKILDAMIHALGGQTYLDVNDIHTTGRFYTFKHDTPTGGDYISQYVKYPMMQRTEIGIARFKQITINNGKDGWKSVPKDKEPQEQLPAEIAEFQTSFKTSLDYVVRFTLAEPKTTVLLVGSEILDFNRADVIEIRDAVKDRIVLYVDRNSKLPVKMQVYRSDEKIMREERFVNWHSFQSVQVPLFVGRYADGSKTMEIRLENVTFDTGLADSLFTVPKK